MTASALRSQLAVYCLAATPQEPSCDTGATCWQTHAVPSLSGTHYRRFRRRIKLCAPSYLPSLSMPATWEKVSSSDIAVFSRVGSRWLCLYKRGYNHVQSQQRKEERTSYYFTSTLVGDMFVLSCHRMIFVS